MHHEPSGRRAEFALLTISDTRSVADDRSGAVARRLVEAAGHGVVAQQIVRDDEARIQAVVGRWLAEPPIDVVVTTGGTGVAPRDRTIEALEPMMRLRLPGFGEIFRALSFAEIGSTAILSRATAGVAENVPIFVLPGSPRAVELALSRLILPEIGHMLAQLGR